MSIGANEADIPFHRIYFFNRFPQEHIRFNFHIYESMQRLAIQAFLGGYSVVVSAPTSSGKTLIAEAAALATVSRGRRIFYTTPLKALSNQKFREFQWLGMS